MKRRSVYYCNYSIGENAYEDVVDVCRFYGKRILLIGGQKGLNAGLDLLKKALQNEDVESSLNENSLKKDSLDDSALDGSLLKENFLEGNPLKRDSLEIVDVVLYGHDCTYKRINELAEYAKSIQADMIFGMGGGKALDTAKGAANKAGLPVFVFPTIAATCAATTALSVVYKEDGAFDSFYFYDRPAYHCFIDLNIIANAPWKYLQAGMGDTIGKFFECHFSARGDRLEHSSWLGKEISNMCYEPLVEYGEQALIDCKNHVASMELEQAVLANIVSTGLVSLMVLDDYNCAIAHSVYYGLVLLPGFEEKWLHGNVVSYGVLVQLAVDNDLEEAKKLKRFLQSLEIPTTLQEMQVPVEREYLQAVLTETVTGPDMEHIPYPVTEDMIFEAMKVVETI